MLKETGAGSIRVILAEQNPGIICWDTEVLAPVQPGPGLLRNSHVEIHIS